MAHMTIGMVRLAATAACSAGSAAITTSNSTFDRTRSASSAKTRWVYLVCPYCCDNQILALAKTRLFQFIEECRIAQAYDRIIKPQKSDPGGPASKLLRAPRAATRMLCRPKQL